MIRVESISKTFESKLALDQVSFEISENECVGLIGNNGAGKSTLIFGLANLLSMDSGKIEIDNNLLTPNYLSYKSTCGFMLSKPYYIEELTTTEYLRFVAKFRDIPNDILIKRQEDLFRVLDFDNPDIKIKALSQGNQVKVSIISSLIHNPSILIYDEPFINLDLKSQDALKNLIVNLKGRKTMFITSHHLGLLIDICDRFLILDEGKVIIDISKGEKNSNEQIKQEIINRIGSTVDKALPNWLE